MAALRRCCHGAIPALAAALCCCGCAWRAQAEVAPAEIAAAQKHLEAFGPVPAGAAAAIAQAVEAAQRLQAASPKDARAARVDLAAAQTKLEELRDQLAANKRIAAAAAAKRARGKLTPTVGGKAAQADAVADIVAHNATWAQHLNQVIDSMEAAVLPGAPANSSNTTDALRNREVMEFLRQAGNIGKGGLVVAAGAKIMDTVSTQLQVRSALCGFHAAQAAQYVARAGIELALAVKQCLPQQGVRINSPSDFLKACMSPCTASVENVLSSLMFTATYISVLASECGRLSNLDALCATMINVLLAGFAQVSSASTLAFQACSTPPKESSPLWPGSVPGTGRRLQESSDAGLAGNPAFTPELAEWDAKTNFDQEDKDLEMSMCVLDATQVATALGTFSLSFDQAMWSCGIHGMIKGVPIADQLFTPSVQELCIVQVSYVLYSMFSAASFLTSAVSRCSQAIGLRRGGLCAAAIERIVTDVAGIPLLAAGMDLTCPGTKADIRKTFGPLARPLATLAAIGRRLSDEEEEDILARGARLLGFNATAPVRAADGLVDGSLHI